MLFCAMDTCMENSMDTNGSVNVGTLRSWIPEECLAKRSLRDCQDPYIQTFNFFSEAMWNGENIQLQFMNDDQLGVAGDTGNETLLGIIRTASSVTSVLDFAVTADMYQYYDYAILYRDLFTVYYSPKAAEYGQNDHFSMFWQILKPLKWETWFLFLVVFFAVLILEFGRCKATYCTPIILFIVKALSIASVTYVYGVNLTAMQISAGYTVPPFQNMKQLASMIQAKKLSLTMIKHEVLHDLIQNPDNEHFRALRTALQVNPAKELEFIPDASQLCQSLEANPHEVLIWWLNDIDTYCQSHQVSLAAETSAVFPPLWFGYLFPKNFSNLESALKIAEAAQAFRRTWLRFHPATAVSAPREFVSQEAPAFHFQTFLKAQIFWIIGLFVASVVFVLERLYAVHAFCSCSRTRDSFIFA